MINIFTNPIAVGVYDACRGMNPQGGKVPLPAPVGDCYEEQSPNDAVNMKGDRARNITDGRMRGKRGDTLAGTLAKTYREFARMPYETTLGMCRDIFQVVGLNALRGAMREEAK